jgi:hypothetical protein
MKKISFVVLSFYCMNLALSQDAYICIPTARTGFSVNPSTKKWEQTRFRIDDDKKILKKNKDKWEWRKFGDKYANSDCTNGGETNSKEGFNSAGYMFCSVIGGSMRVSKNTLRYIETYEMGFVDGKDKNDDTPMIEIGTCSPL